MDRHPARQGHRRGPGRERDLDAHRRRARRDAPLRPAGGRARLGAARAARARARGARRGLPEPGRRDRAAQPGALEPRGGGGAPRRRGAARVPHLRLRGGGLRRGGGRGRAPGLRGRRDRPLPALPARGRPLHPRGGAGPDHARDPASLAAFATRELRRRGIEIRTGTLLERVDAETATLLSTGERIPARTVAWTAGREARARGGRRWACRWATTGASWWTRRCACRGARTCGRSATPRPCPIPPSAARRPARPRRSTPCARARWWPTAWPPRSPAASRAASATERSACSWTWASTRRWRRCSACACAASPPGSPRAPTTWRSMPGVARRLRLMADWTVALFFGRAAAELGQLGHPPSLGQPASRTRQGRSRDGDRRARVQGGTRGRHPGHLRARGACRCATRWGAAGWSSAAADQTFVDEEWPRQRPLLEFIAAQPGTGFWVCEDEGELVGYVRVARFTGMDELTEIAVAPVARRRRDREGAARARLARAADARARPGRGHPRHACRPDALHALRRDAGGRALAPAPARRGVPGAALARDRRHRAGGARADPGAGGGGVEAPRAGGHRPRAARAARVLRRARAAASRCWTAARRGQGRSAG